MIAYCRLFACLSVSPSVCCLSDSFVCLSGAPPRQYGNRRTLRTSRTWRPNFKVRPPARQACRGAHT